MGTRSIWGPMGTHGPPWRPPWAPMGIAVGPRGDNRGHPWAPIWAPMGIDVGPHGDDRGHPWAPKGKIPIMYKTPFNVRLYGWHFVLFAASLSGHQSPSSVFGDLPLSFDHETEGKGGVASLSWAGFNFLRLDPKRNFISLGTQ